MGRRARERRFDYQLDRHCSKTVDGRDGGTRTRTGNARVLLGHVRLPIPPRPDVGYNQLDRRKLGLRGPGRPPVIFLARIFGRFLPRRFSLYPDHREAVPCGQVPHFP